MCELYWISSVLHHFTSVLNIFTHSLTALLICSWKSNFLFISSLRIECNKLAKASNFSIWRDDTMVFLSSLSPGIASSVKQWWYTHSDLNKGLVIAAAAAGLIISFCFCCCCCCSYRRSTVLCRFSCCRSYSTSWRSLLYYWRRVLHDRLRRRLRGLTFYLPTLLTECYMRCRSKEQHKQLNKDPFTRSWQTTQSISKKQRTKRAVQAPDAAFDSISAWSPRTESCGEVSILCAWGNHVTSIPSSPRAQHQWQRTVRLFKVDESVVPQISITKHDQFFKSWKSDECHETACTVSLISKNASKGWRSCSIRRDPVHTRGKRKTLHVEHTEDCLAGLAMLRLRSLLQCCANSFPILSSCGECGSDIWYDIQLDGVPVLV